MTASPKHRRPHLSVRAGPFPDCQGEAGPVADGTGLTVGDRDVVGTTVGSGVLLLAVGLVVVARALGAGVGARRDGEVDGVAGAVVCAGAGVTLATCGGLNVR